MVDASVHSVSIAPARNLLNRLPDQPKIYLTPILDFSASKQAIFFQKLKQREFNGQLIFRDNRGIASTFYFYMGRLVYATGGFHPMRRWQRQLLSYCPEILLDIEIVRQSCLDVVNTDSIIGWEYKVLCELSRQQKISFERLNQLIRSTIAEILFDLTYAKQLSYYRKSEQFRSTPLTIINSEPIVAHVWQQSQEWQDAKLADRSPNSAPIIKSTEELKNRTSPLTYQLLTQRLNGQSSLRDLAAQLKQDVLCLTRSLMIYVQLGLVDLISIADLPKPVDILVTPQEVVSKQLLVAYGDENPQMCRRMELIMHAAGYRFLGVQDGRSAVSMFIEQKPDVIFLRSHLGHTDGYAICHELRKFPIFGHTPIFILTHNLSLVKRIQAKLSGASEIIDISFTGTQIYQLLDKYHKI